MHMPSQLALPILLSVGLFTPGDGSAEAVPNARADRVSVPVEPLAGPPGSDMAKTEPVTGQEREPPRVAKERIGASQACAHGFEVIWRGEGRCGIGLGEDDRIYLDGRPIGEPVVGWGRPSRLFLSPPSPGGQFRIIDVCGEMCGKAFVLDLQQKRLQDTFAGRYGPMKDWISWSPDGAYAVLAYEDEGFAWLYVVRAADGASWEVLNDGLLVRPESLRWLDTEIVEVRALSCRGGLQACASAHERGSPGELVRVTLTARGPTIDWL